MAKPPAATEARFKEPILSLLFRILGSVCLVFAGLGFIGAIGDAAAVWTMLGVAGSMLLAAVVLFGAAQVISAVAETAFNTRRTADQANRALELLTSSRASDRSETHN